MTTFQIPSFKHAIAQEDRRRTHSVLLDLSKMLSGELVKTIAYKIGQVYGVSVFLATLQTNWFNSISISISIT